MLNPHHILTEFDNFVQTIVKDRNNAKKISAPSLIRTSINLLDDLPAAREIVFEYFGLVAELAIQNYVANANIDPQTGLLTQQTKNNSPNNQTTTDDKESNIFEPIQQALENLVLNGPSAWGPLVTSWSLGLIAQLCEKYTTRKMTIIASCNFWLKSTVMHGLLTNINLCFRKFTFLEAESCVQTLLTSFQHYPVSFGWVVARLGSCFPMKIMTQVLQCSLKRFSEDSHYRMDTEVGILEYLSSPHEKDMQTAFKEMMLAGFQPKRGLDASIIPYLSVLTTYSDALLVNVAVVFLEIYNPQLLYTIIQRAPLWLSNSLFAEMQPTLSNVALRLKLKGVQIFMLVAKMAEDYEWCQDFLEYSLLELEQVILNVHTCPLMNDLVRSESKEMLWKNCLSRNIYEQQTAVRLLLIISTQENQIYYQTINELVRKDYTDNPDAIGALLRLLAGQSGVVEFPDVTPGVSMALEDILMQELLKNPDYSFDNDKIDALNTFKNLNTINLLMLKMQDKKESKLHQNPLIINNSHKEYAKALFDCQPKILEIFCEILTKLLLHRNEEAKHKMKATQLNENQSFYNRKKIKLENEYLLKNFKNYREDSTVHENRLVLAHTIMELLVAIDKNCKGMPISTAEVLKLAVQTVKYFFVSLTENDGSIKGICKSAAAANRAFVLLESQCSARKAARTACLRELIEGVLFYYGYLFGKVEDTEEDQLQIPKHELVLAQNQKLCEGPNINRTVLHAGVIGRGLRNYSSTDGVRCDPAVQRLLLKALNSCCVDKDKQNNAEGYVIISLLLVEMVSPDVMYNGLPFPEEEFTKVTIERDLLIRRAFTTSPILWAFLGFIATHRPALCLSSVLLRALCATCLHQWRAKNVDKLYKLDKNEDLYVATKKLLEILAMGQLLPPPLSYLHLIIEHLDPPEVALLLKECVWNYLKDHVPAPALFQIDNNGLHWRNPKTSIVPPQYVDTLRNLMQKKLSTLGQLYHQMFIMSEVHESSDEISSDQNINTKSTSDV